MGLKGSRKRKAAAKLLLLSLQQKERKYWVHPVNKLREIEGDQVRLDRKYKYYPDRFKKALRVTPDQFDELLRLLGSSIQKEEGKRGCIPPRVRLYVTLK